MTQVFKLTISALLLGTLFSCDKPVEPPFEPIPGVSLSRTVTLTNQGNLVKSAVYFGVSAVEPKAIVEGGKLNFSFNANNSDKPWEGVLLAIDESNLQAGPVKTYKFSGSPETIRLASYGYSYKRSDGSTWGSVVDTRTGNTFEGELTITAYDATYRLISGRFTMKALNMIFDPTKERTGSQIDPVDYCTLELEGQFSRIKIQ